MTRATKGNVMVLKVWVIEGFSLQWILSKGFFEVVLMELGFVLAIPELAVFRTCCLQCSRNREHCVGSFFDGKKQGIFDRPEVIHRLFSIDMEGDCRST